MRNNIELLMALGIDDAPTRNNINEYIKNLKGLQNVKVALEVDGSGGKGFSEYDKQIKNLQAQVEKLSAMLGSVGKGGGKGGLGSAFDGFQQGADKSIKSLQDLENEMKALNGQIRISKNAQDEVYKVVTKIKDETGKIREFKYAPEFDEAGVMQGFRKVNTAIDNLNSKDLKLNTENAMKELKNLEKQGRLTKSEYDDLKKSITEAPSNKTLRETVELMREMDKEAGIDGKIFKGGDKVFKNLDELEQRLERIIRLNGKHTDKTAISAIREEMDKIRNMDLSNISGVQRAMAEISKVRGSVNNLGTGAVDSKAFEASMDKAKKALKSLSDESIVAQKHIDTMYRRINNVPVGNLAELQEHMKRINALMDANKTRRITLEGMEQNIVNVKKLEAELTRYYELNKKYVKKEDYEAMRTRIDKLRDIKIIDPQSAKEAQNTFKVLNADVKQFGANATQASRNSMTMVNALKVALERFPIWMASSTAFFATVGTAKEFVRILVDIDSKLTSIKKIAGEADMDKVFDDATASAERFGQSISAVLDAYIEFSRQGYKGGDLNTLANAGLVAANVGEIDAGKASEYLTSTLVQWNKETKEAMGVIDSWNELSNNYATTLDKLAEGQTRAGATAKAVGMDFNQLNAVIGTLTARTKQSGSEIGNFIKASIPRLLSEPAQDVMKQLNVQLTDDAGNMRDVMQVYTEIAEKSKDISQSQRLAVAEGLAGKYHISRMQSLLDDLASADGLYKQMYESSKNSTGSAMRENEIYMESLEAKIALVRVEFEKMAVAVGKAFMTDGMLTFLSAMRQLLEVLQVATEKIGILPIIFGTLATVIMLVSTRAKMLASSVWSATSSFTAATVGTRSFSGALTTLKVSAMGASVGINAVKGALRGLAAATVVGAVFAALGIVLEKVMAKFGDTSKEMEDLESTSRQITDTFKANKDELNELVSVYGQLQGKIKDGTIDDEGMKKYQETANQIGQIMPSLIVSEDTYGNKVLGSADALATKLKLIEDQVRAEEKLKATEEDGKRKEDIATYNKELDDSKNKIDVLIGSIEVMESSSERLAKKMGVPKEMRFKFTNEKGEPVIDSVESLVEQVEVVKEKLKAAQASGNDGQIKYWERLDEQLSETYAKILPLQQQAQKSITALKVKYAEGISSIIQSNDELTDSAKATAEAFSTAIIDGATEENIDKVKNALESIYGDVSNTNAMTDAMSSLKDMARATGENYDELAKKAKKALADLPKILLDSGVSAKDVDIIMKSLNKRFDDAVKHHNDLAKEAKKTGKSIAELTIELESEGEATGKLIKEIKTLSNVYEELAGVSQKQVDYTDDMIFKYDMLQTQMGGLSDQEAASLALKKNLSSEEKYLVGVYQQKQGVIADLTKIYPELLGKDGKAIALSKDKIAAIKVENDANKALLKAYQLVRDGKISAENATAIVAVEKTKARIAAVREEIAMMQKLAKASIISMQIAMSGTGFGGMASKALEMAYDQKIGALKKELDDLNASLPKQVGNLTDLVAQYDDSQKKANKTAKETTKTTKEQAYQTDIYKQKLDEVNAAIEKQQLLLGKMAPRTAEYRRALEKEMKLQQQKLDILKQQEKVLINQSKGIGLKTTQVTTTTGDVGGQVATGKTGKLSGWGGVVTSNFGTRKDNHRGIDIANSRGTRIDANVSGKVIASGDAKANGMHWSYGNLVVVQDDSGLKHIYAHMDKAMAKIGDRIEAGMQIGTVGNTGHVITSGDKSKGAGSHLHYEVDRGSTPINPNQFYANAKNGVFTTYSGGGGGTTSTSTIVENRQQQIDQAKSELAQMGATIAQQQQVVDSYYKATIDSYLATFEWNKNNADKYLENGENRLKRLSEASGEYRHELDSQIFTLKKKKNYNQQEMDYLKKQLTNTKLGQEVIDEYTQKLHELGKVNSEIDFAIKDYDIAKMESFNKMIDETIDKFRIRRDYAEKSLEYEKLALQEIDTNSEQYIRALNGINQKLREKQAINRDELQALTNQVNTGKLYGEALENAKRRMQELRQEIKQTQYDIQEGDWEIIVNVKTRSEEIQAGIQFEIDRADKIRNMYEQGSADYKRYTEIMISEQKKMADELLRSKDAMLAELKTKDISIQRSKELTQMLRQQHLAYLDATTAIETYTKQLKEANDSQLKDLAEKFINSYKQVIQERRDAHMRAIDEEVKRENERHEAVKKALNDELALFRKNIEERKRLIQRGEAERDYNMEIADMEKERSKIQDEINLLALEDTNEAKSKRKKLQEQLDKIDKDIAEKRHDRDIELQLQGLDDQMELKEEEINGKNEIEDQFNKDEIQRLNDRRQYWEKHYNDLLNDERKFTQIREDILAGHFDKVMAEFNEYIDEMERTMPELADTLNGTMTAVGMTIRQNLIDNMREAIKLMNEYIETQKLVDNPFQDGFENGKYEDGFGNIGQQGKGGLSSGDLQIMMGKFLNDMIAPQLSGAKADNLRELGHGFGSSGRQNGGTISKDIDFNTAFAGMTPAEVESLKAYLSSQSGYKGGQYESYFQQWLNGNPMSGGSVNGKPNANPASKYGIGVSMSRGDLQVMMGKYLREFLVTQTSNEGTKQALRDTGSKMAESGRANGSKISSNVGYNEVMNTLSEAHRMQLKNFMLTYYTQVADPTLQGYIRNYAASLDTGGYMNWGGSGIDGKGGRAIIAHPQEVMLDKFDTQSLWNSIDVMEKVSRSLAPFAAKYDKRDFGFGSGGYGDTYVSFGDVLEATPEAAKGFATEFINQTRRKRGNSF